MRATLSLGGEAGRPAGSPSPELARYQAYFHELDAWTEYWDIYHPESNGRYYFGAGDEPGLLRHLVPREQVPPIFTAYKQRALGIDRTGAFARALDDPALAAAVLEYDALVAAIVHRHFGEPPDATRYLEAMYLFAVDDLPPAPERLAAVPAGDPRRRTAGRHTIDADMMWFVWALQLEAAHLLSAGDKTNSMDALLLAGVAAGCSANFAARGHRRTRPEYEGADGEATRQLIHKRALVWAGDANAAIAEIHALYRIREWGHA
jgi:hypothetical protein